jgi:hypothetical protein
LLADTDRDAGLAGSETFSFDELSTSSAVVWVAGLVRVSVVWGVALKKGDLF